MRLHSLASDALYPKSVFLMITLSGITLFSPYTAIHTVYMYLRVVFIYMRFSLLSVYLFWG